MTEQNSKFNFINLDTSSSSVEVSHILVVDDEKVIREILADFLTLEGFNVTTASDGQDAIERLKESTFNMVISDLKMPQMGGLELLEYIQDNHDDLLTVIMTGFGTVQTAIEAMKKGAYDYILKPFKVEEVVHIVHRGMEKQRLKSENVRLKEILDLHRLSEELQSTLSLNEVIDSILSTLLKNLDCDYVSLNLKERSTGKFNINSFKVKSPELNNLGDSILKPGIIVNELKLKHYILAQNSDAAYYFENPPDNICSFVSIPLVARQDEIGFLSAFNSSSGNHFTGGQRKMMDILGSRSAAAIDNAELYGNLQQSFKQTILALARALEAMDTYTAGHSDRVTVYARLIGEAMAISPHDIEVITQSAMLHDIGKLGCHTNLNKPEKLTAEEYEIFKQHPAYGKQILEPIEFLHTLIPGVEHHHERWDGKGYPSQLKGENIPLVARILAIADSYDAMTSDRAYRKALKHSAAIAEISRFSGTQFDPEIADAFLSGIERYRKDCIERGIPVPE